MTAETELPADDLPWQPATLTGDVTRELRRPFGVGAVEFRPIGKASGGATPKCAIVFYIDSRLVVDRLNQVAGPENWSDAYQPLAPAELANTLYFPVECRLSVFGVVKADVGQGANQVLDDKAWKTAYSDALKRAAVKFGVGRFLYSIPRIRVECDVDDAGKLKWLSRKGTADAEAAYERWLANPQLNVYGPPLDAEPYPAKEGGDDAG